MTATTREPALADTALIGPAPPSRRMSAWTRLAAQAITLAAGVFFVVVGAVALARAGIPADGDLTRPEVTVGWLHHTPLLAVAHLLVGAGLLSTGWYAAMDARPSFLSLLAIIFGLVTWIEPDALHPALGTHRIHGVTYLVVGVLHLAAGLLASRGTIPAADRGP